MRHPPMFKEPAPGSSIAALSVVLASVGMYGVVSFTVSLRTRSIGVRMALGASSVRAVIDVVRQILSFGLLGLLAGVLAAAALSRYVRGILFEIDPLDPGTYLLTAALLIVLLIFASYAPARRAARLHPTTVLRAD